MYTRWGRRDCPNTAGTELVYTGITAGSFWNSKGGGANYLCLPYTPRIAPYAYRPGVQGTNTLYWTEYETSAGPSTTRPVYNTNAPCAVCYTSTKSVALMIPGQNTCPHSWRQEYTGYLMSASSVGNHSRTTYECVDKTPEALHYSAGNHHYAAVFYHVEISCNGIPCPPYNAQKELVCAMCTK